jgi:hypothetical protein
VGSSSVPWGIRAPRRVKRPGRLSAARRPPRSPGCDPRAREWILAAPRSACQRRAGGLGGGCGVRAVKCSEARGGLAGPGEVRGAADRRGTAAMDLFGKNFREEGLAGRG